MPPKQDVTIVDVARRAGLSPSTVSRVLNQKGYFSAENAARVHAAVAELGYRRAGGARVAAGQPSRLVGLIMPDISNVFYTAIAGAVLDDLRVLGYELILCVNNEDAALDRDYLEMLQAKGVAVLGVSTDQPQSQKAFREKYRLPFRLLADADKKVLGAFGLSTTLGFSPRTAYLFEDGKCVWVDPKSSTGDQAAVALEFLATRGK